MLTERTDRAWFSRLLCHLARKCSGYNPYNRGACTGHISAKVSIEEQNKQRVAKNIPLSHKQQSEWPRMECTERKSELHLIFNKLST